MKLKLLLFFSSFLLVAKADRVAFSYDNAGNRVKREILISKKSAPQHKGVEPLSEMLSDKEIKIYPNPTDGLLKVEICGYEDSDECKLSVFNMSGKQVLSMDVSSALSDMDITSQPDGMYILLIVINGEKSTWKIIKE